MFAFGRDTKNGFVFLRKSREAIFTCPGEAMARGYYKGIKDEWDLYRLDMDLFKANLLAGTGPKEIELTEEQKHALWAGYVYKSLLTWAPYPEEVRC